jgi:predicted DNA-binding transcriptional regulator AlpA
MSTPSSSLLPVPRTSLEEFLDLNEVKRRTCKSKTSIYTDPSFPKPIKLNSGRTRSVRSVWLASEVTAWMLMRIKASRPDHGSVEDSEQVAS